MIIGEFCDVFPPELDGVGMVVKSFVKQLNDENNTCYYIAPKAKKPIDEGMPSLQYTSMKIPKEPYRLGLPVVDLLYQKKVDAVDFDIVHAHSPFTAGAEAMRVAKEKGIPLVGSFHSKYYDDFMMKTKSKVLSKAGVKIVVAFYEKCDEVWTVNDSTAEVLRGYGFGGNITVIPNGTNLWYPTDDDRRAATDKYNLGDGHVLLFVGQHSFKKNTKHIIEAVSLYAKKHDDFKMVFAGQGPDAEKMRELVDELGISSRVVFTGHIMDRNTIMGLYARAELLVFPSLYDNAPMVVREAAAAGTPALLVKGSCAAEGVTDGENGFLCKDTPEDIAATMERALPQSAEVGAHARDTIPLPWSCVGERIISRYENLIAKSKR